MSTTVTRTKVYERTSPTLVPVNLVDEFDTIALIDTAQGAGQTNDTRILLQTPSHSRIRQAGTVEAVRIHRNDGVTTNLTSIIFQIWRKDIGGDDLYDLVGETENFITAFNALSTDSFGTITFSTPITGVQEGDFTAIEFITGAGGTASSLISSVTDVVNTSFFLTGGAIGTTNVDFDAAATSLNWMPFEVQMKNPVISCIGTSQTAGHNLHDSYLEDGTNDDAAKSWPNKLGVLYGVTIQNMGQGGSLNRVTHGLARFARDVVEKKPSICIIDYGTGGVSNGDVDIDTLFRNIHSMMSQCYDNGIIPVVLSIPPRTDLTDAEHLERQRRNSILKSLADAAPNSAFVDLEETVGQFRSSGPPGNLWDISTSPDYNDDDIHFTEAGNVAIAAKIKETLDAKIIETVEVDANTSMTTSQRNAILNPPEGLTFYDTTLNKGVRRAASSWETITSS